MENTRFTAYAALNAANPFADLRSRQLDIEFHATPESAARDLTEGAVVIAVDVTVDADSFFAVVDAEMGETISMSTNPGMALDLAVRSSRTARPALVRVVAARNGKQVLEPLNKYAVTAWRQVPDKTGI